jgi:hypothetical protein
MERQAAIATVMYLQKAVSIVPTTGQEWDAVRSVLRVIELVANGQATVMIEHVDQERVSNGHDKAEPRAEARAQ